MQRINIPSSKIAYAAYIVLAWTLYGVFFGSQTYIRRVYFGGVPDWQESLAIWLTCGYSWAILTPPIMVLARRFPFSRETWLRAAAIQVPLSLVFSIMALAIFTGFRMLAGEVYSFERFRNLVIDDIHSCIFVYFGILAVSYSLAYTRMRHGETIESDARTNSIPPRPTTPEKDNQAPRFVERFVVKERGRIAFISIDAVDRITSDGNYVKLHTNGRSHLVRETMKALEQKLDAAVFVRARRSAIVRIALIRELRPLRNGELEIVLRNGVTIAASRRYKKRLLSLMKT